MVHLVNVADLINAGIDGEGLVFLMNKSNRFSRAIDQVAFAVFCLEQLNERLKLNAMVMARNFAFRQNKPASIGGNGCKARRKFSDAFEGDVALLEMM